LWTVTIKTFHLSCTEQNDSGIKAVGSKTQKINNLQLLNNALFIE